MKDKMFMIMFIVVINSNYKDVSSKTSTMELLYKL